MTFRPATLKLAHARSELSDTLAYLQMFKSYSKDSYVFVLEMVLLQSTVHTISTKKSLTAYDTLKINESS